MVYRHLPHITGMLFAVFFLLLNAGAVLADPNLEQVVITGGVTVGSEVTLTPEEQNWLASHPDITLGTDRGWRPYVFVDKTGGVTGIESDLIERINALTGANIRLVTGVWAEMVERAKAGEIDGLAVSAHHPERADHSLFTDSPYSLFKYIYTLTPGFSEMDDLAGKRVGLRKGNRLEQKLLRNSTGIRPIPAESDDALLSLLTSGGVDAVIGGISFRLTAREMMLPDVRLAFVVPDSETAMLYSIRKDWPELQSIINKALAAIPLSERLAILDKWGALGAAKVKTPSIMDQLTQEEKAWLEKHPEIIVAHDGSFAPYSFQKPSGAFAGAIIDYMELLAEKLGIRINVYPNGTWDDLYEAAKLREVDVVSALTYRPEREQWFAFSRPYLGLPVYIVTRKEDDAIRGKVDLADRTVALVRGYWDSEQIIREHPTIKPLYMDSLSEALQAVVDRRADATLAPMGVGQYTILKQGFVNLKMTVPVTDYKGQISLGVRKDWPVLTSILNKADAAIPEERKLTILAKWIPGFKPPTVSYIDLTSEEKAWIETNQAVSVGLWDLPPANFMDNGIARGYRVELLETMLSRAGLQPTYRYLPLGDIIKGLKEGEIDVSLSFIRTRERFEYLDYALHETPINIAIFAQKGRTDISDTASLQGKVIASYKGYSMEAALKKMFPEASVTQADDKPGMFQLVATGEADFCVQEVATGNYHLWKGNFTNLEQKGFFRPPGTEKKHSGDYVVRKSLPVLTSILHKAERTMTPVEMQRMRDRWYAAPPSDEPLTEPVLDLTYKETEWLSNHPVITMCVDPDWMPFEQINDKGKYEGMIADYMSLISARLGVPFRLVPTETFPESLSKLSAGDCALLSSWAPVVGMEEHGISTSPYLTLQDVLAVHIDRPFISEHDSLAGLRIGAVVEYPTQGKVKKLYPDAELVLVENVDQGVRKVSTGELDAFAATQSTIGYSIQKQHLTNVKLGGIIPGDEHVRMVVNRNEPILSDILDKAIASITQEDHQRIADKWFAVRFERGIDYSLFWKLSLGFLLILAGILAWNHVIRRQKQALTASEAKLRETSDALIESERRLRESQSYAHLGQWQLDLINDSLEWSDEVYRIFEIDKNIFTASYETFLDHIHPDDKEAVDKAYSDSLVNKTPYEIVHRLQMPDGRIKYVREQCRTEYECDKPIHSIGTIQDITALKEKEVELQQAKETADAAIIALNMQQQRLDYVFNATQDGIWDWDIVKDEAYCSPIYFQMLGYEPDEFPVNNSQSVWLDLIHPDDLEKTLADTERQIADSDEPYSVEFRMRCKDGHYKWILDRGKVISRDTEGKPIRLVGAHVDIDLYKQMENQLRNAKEEAESANQAKSIFLANMSHELRTPLNAILGFSQMLAGSDDTTPRQQEKLAIINRSGEHLLAMVNDVLDLSKIEAGRIELEPQAFKLPEMLRDIAHMFEVRAGEAGLEFNLELDSELAHTVVADTSKLRQILINLLGNAVKFTREGGFILRTSTLPLEDSASRITLRLEVEDSGTGIEPEQLERIFDSFSQAGRSNGEMTGTGLGLAITRAFVEVMGGDINVESTPGKGSLFLVQIPIAMAESDEVHEELPRKKVVGLEEGQQAWRILVVEDNPENRVLMTELLQHTGFEIREAENGEQAVEHFQQWLPHFIWMDMRMPVMDGYEAIRNIRKLPGGDKVKIVALTASAFRDQQNTILEAGCDDVVYKPFRIREIFDTMGEQLDVRYRYESAAGESTSKPAVVNAEKIAPLPQELQEILLKAARSLSINEFEEAVVLIRQHDAELADGLATMAREFRFDQILDVLSKVHTDV